MISHSPRISHKAILCRTKRVISHGSRILNKKNTKGMFVYTPFPRKGEIVTSANSIEMKSIGKKIPWDSVIHVWCEFFFLVELVLMLFGVAMDSL